MIRLYTSFYPESDPTRREELLECLERNLRCSGIDSVCLFLENIDEPPLGSDKLDSRRIDRRPTYREYFDWCNENIQSDEDASIVANSDIFFDIGLTRLASALKTGLCAALARWNVQPDGKALLYDRNDSQDSWIFRGSIRSFDCDYQMGVPRCDNRILYELKLAGYEVINPAFSIRSYHLHKGDREEYAPEHSSHFVDPPYAYLWPHNLFSWPMTMLCNLTQPSNRIRWRVDRRWIEATLPARAVRKLARLLKRRT